MLITTLYHHHTGKLTAPVTFAVVSDLHDEPYERIFPMIEGADALLVPGDVTNRYTKGSGIGIAFLRDAVKRMPVFYSLGNHDRRQECYTELMKKIERIGVTVLINRYVRFGECVIGGWYSPLYVPQPDMLDAYEKEKGCRVLLSHKPEWYIENMRGRDIDLVVAGHAHGGQIRLNGRGLYSPGQGILPAYTRGIVEDRMIISAGVGNPNGYPRWGNPEEVLRITLD